MKISSLSEKEIISAIRDSFVSSKKNLIQGIGDDAAVVRIGKKNFIYTKDLLIQDVHFKISFHPPHLLARKSLNINLSDVAAMGGVPSYALLGLGLPTKIDSQWVEDFINGLKSAAQEEGVNLIGGDLSRSKKITVSVTVIGEGDSIITRSGGASGDKLCVSGTLGDAKEGLLLLQRKHRMGESREIDFILKRFLDPFPQVSLGRELSRRNLVSSMIDLSDGISVDLGHICEESGCGALIYKNKLPISGALRSLQKKCFDFALHGGEDYQLLFSVPKEKMSQLSELKKIYPISTIGELISEKKIYVVDPQGRKKELKSKGYRHF